jgi:hypothetical protein
MIGALAGRIGATAGVAKSEFHERALCSIGVISPFQSTTRKNRKRTFACG